MAKNDKVAQARKLFVQARAEKTGQTTAEAKAKYRERFEKLAATKEGRAKIQQLTGLQGVRKELKSAYGQKNTTKSTTTTDTTSTKIPGVGVAAPVTKTEAQTEIYLRSQPKSYKAIYQSKSGTAAQTSAKTSSGGGLSKSGLIKTGAVVAGGYAVADRAYRLSQIQKVGAQASTLGMNPAEVQASLRGLGYKPQSLGKAGLKGIRSAAGKTKTKIVNIRGGGSLGAGGGGPRGTDDRQVVQ